MCGSDSGRLPTSLYFGPHRLSVCGENHSGGVSVVPPCLVWRSSRREITRKRGAPLSTRAHRGRPTPGTVCQPFDTTAAPRADHARRPKKITRYVVCSLVSAAQRHPANHERMAFHSAATTYMTEVRLCRFLAPSASGGTLRASTAV